MSAPPSAYSPLLPRQHLPSAATAAHDPASYASALGARVYSRLTDEPPAAAAARTDSRAGDTPGDLRYKRIVHALTRTDPIRLLPYQLDFVRACMTPTLPQIYGDEWVRDRAGVLARHGIDNFYEEVFYIASRRMGKTLTMAMFAVAYALSIPSDGSHPFRIAIFSVNKDAALRFIEECRVVMRSIDPALLDEFEISGKADRIVFRSRTDPNDVRTITSYPGRGNIERTTLAKYRRTGTKDIYTTLAMTTLRFAAVLLVALAAGLVAAYPTGWHELRFVRGTPPTDLGGYAAVSIGRSVYAFGGIRDVVSPDGAWANEVDTFFNDVYEYDTLMRRWTKHSPPAGAVEAGQWPAARAFYAAAASKADPGAFYVFGGATYDKGGLANYADFADVWKFDTVSKTWELLADGSAPGQPPALAYPAIFEAGGKLYVMYGTTATRQSNGVMWTMDIATRQWSQVDTGEGPAPHARFAAMVVERDETDTVISFGGETLQVTPTGMVGTNYADLWEFDPAVDRWTRLDDGSAPAFAPRAYSAYGISGGVLAVHGGSISQPDDSDVPDALSTDETHFYDLVAGGWHACPWPMRMTCMRRGPDVKRSAAAVISGGRLLHFGGFRLTHDADSGTFTQMWNNDMHEFLLPPRIYG